MLPVLCIGEQQASLCISWHVHVVACPAAQDDWGAGPLSFGRALCFAGSSDCSTNSHKKLQWWADAQDLCQQGGRVALAEQPERCGGWPHLA